MLVLSMAALVVVPPTAPLLIGILQVTLVCALALLRIVDINTLTAYALLAHGMQLNFWLTAGSWALSRMKISLPDLSFCRLRVVVTTYDASNVVCLKERRNVLKEQ